MNRKKQYTSRGTALIETNQHIPKNRHADRYNYYFLATKNKRASSLSIFSNVRSFGSKS